MVEPGILSLIPPLLAISLAILTKDVLISLTTGLFPGQLILHDFNPADAFVGLFDSVIALFSEGWITKTILFAVLVGSIIRLIVASGGVNGFVDLLTHKKNLVRSKRSALLLTYLIGLMIFIESSITSLIAGTVGRPLTDKFGASRQKLAYVCDSTSAPVCSLLALNAWGALLIGLITAQISAGTISGNATRLFITSIPYNFYAWVALALVLLVILTNRDIGSMKTYEQQVIPQASAGEAVHGNIWKMLLPLGVLIATVPVVLYLSGKGNILNGSGSTAVFYAVISCLLFTFVYYLLTRTMDKKTWYENFYLGIGDMLPIALVLILAFAIGNITNTLGTGVYLAGLAKDVLSPSLIPVIVFLLSALIAFSTGTSWGTFSIMMPVAIPMAVATGSDVPLVIGAVVSGGIFGDHASPISDTTIISSMAAGCDPIEHVTTQLPYALLGAVIAAILFVISGVLTS